MASQRDHLTNHMYYRYSFDFFHSGVMKLNLKIRRIRLESLNCLYFDNYLYSFLPHRLVIYSWSFREVLWQFKTSKFLICSPTPRNCLHSLATPRLISLVSYSKTSNSEISLFFLLYASNPRIFYLKLMK